MELLVCIPCTQATWRLVSEAEISQTYVWAWRNHESHVAVACVTWAAWWHWESHCRMGAEIWEVCPQAPISTIVIPLMIFFRYYYQYDIEHLPACTLTIHSLLHVVQGIWNCGPVWTTWTFHMEQFCGMLQNSLHSWSHPWSNLNKVLLHCTYLEQLWMQYDLSEELANEGEWWWRSSWFWMYSWGLWVCISFVRY